MIEAGSRVEFNTLDYLHGLTIYVDDRAIYSIQPARANAAPIDGAGWAEAAFEPEPETVPVQYRVSVKCNCGRTHPSLESWRHCDAPALPMPTYYGPMWDGLVTDVMRGQGE